MSRLPFGNNDNDNDGGARWFESDPTPINWQQFHSFLLQRMTAKTAEDRLRYAKQYAHVLEDTSTGITAHLLQLTPNKRIHVMKSLSSLARFTGRTEQWRQIRQQYGLAWSTGTEKIDAFTRFFDDSKDLDTMLQWLRQALQVLPKDHANFYLFCTLTGLRGSECLEAVKLLRNPTRSGYYNPEQQMLQHYRFPALFIRRTKAVYISVVDDSIVAVAQNIRKMHTLEGLKMAIRHSSQFMRLKYCRKIYASWLHKSGISSDLIDMLQGRIGKNIFLKHYLVPESFYKAKVLDAVEKLQKELYFIDTNGTRL
jgi:hypothetical protein